MYVGTLVIPDQSGGLGKNTFIGPNIADTATITGTGICGIGTDAFKSTAGITGSFLTGIGNRSFGSGNLTSATQVTTLGYETAFSVTTATSGLWLGYQAGKNLTTDSGTIILGPYLGTAGVDSNKFIVANPENSNVFINIEDTDAAFAENMMLGTSGGILTLVPVPSSSVFTYNPVTGTSATMVADNGYDTQNASLTTLTLPSTAAAYTVIKVVGTGAGGWTIAQNAGQTIVMADTTGDQTSTTGVTGSLSSLLSGDCVTLLCIVADTTWKVIEFNAPNGLELA